MSGTTYTKLSQNSPCPRVAPSLQGKRGEAVIQTVLRPEALEVGAALAGWRMAMVLKRKHLEAIEVARG